MKPFPTPNQLTNLRTLATAILGSVQGVEDGVNLKDWLKTFNNVEALVEDVTDLSRLAFNVFDQLTEEVEELDALKNER